MVTWWQQQEVLQLLLVTVKVLLASFLLGLLPLVLAQATLSQVNDDDCCSNVASTRTTAAMNIVYQIQQGLHQVLLEQCQAKRTPELTKDKQEKAPTL